MDCELLSSIKNNNNKLIESAYFDYCKRINSLPLHPVWYDYIDDVCFGADEDYTNARPYDTCFLVQPEDFLNDTRHGIPIMEKFFEETTEVKSSKEIIYEPLNTLEKYKNKNIFIIGAGPSTSMVDLDSVERDYVWVCNDFLNHEKVKNLDVSLFYMSNEVWLKESSKEYMKNNPDTICAFDLNVSRNKQVLNTYKKLCVDRCLVYSMRMFSSTGIMPRLINLAAILGAKKVSFVGLDGYAEEDYNMGKFDSAFETKKKNITKGFNYRSQIREYIMFWEHMKKIHPNTTFENFGNIYEHNVTKNILGVI